MSESTPKAMREGCHILLEYEAEGEFLSEVLGLVQKGYWMIQISL